jgi:hypothetical protein
MNLIIFIYALVVIWVLLGTKVYINAYNALLYKLPPTKSVKKFKENLKKHPKSTKFILFCICVLLWPRMTNLL